MSNLNPLKQLIDKNNSILDLLKINKNFKSIKLGNQKNLQSFKIIK